MEEALSQEQIKTISSKRSGPFLVKFQVYSVEFYYYVGGKKNKKLPYDIPLSFKEQLDTKKEKNR